MTLQTTATTRTSSIPAPMPGDRYVDVDGHRTRCWRLGDAGSPVVLLHGIACSVLEWRHNVDALAAHHRLHVIDLLGFGLTDKPADETYGVSRLARFVLAYTDAAGLARAHLAGSSLGGRIALECAALAPGRVASRRGGRLRGLRSPAADRMRTALRRDGAGVLATLRRCVDGRRWRMMRA